jgi:hypothetical protein
MKSFPQIYALAIGFILTGCDNGPQKAFTMNDSNGSDMSGQNAYIDPFTYSELDKKAVIFVRITQNNPQRANINGMDMSVEEAQVWLHNAKETFGPHDPVIFVFDSDVSVSILLTWRGLVEKTHPKIWMVSRTQDGSKDIFHLLGSDIVINDNVSKNLRLIFARHDP